MDVPVVLLLQRSLPMSVRIPDVMYGIKSIAVREGSRLNDRL